jgi:hypothetical protein
MEKRFRRRTRDLVTQAAFQSLSENEIGCARISMMARSKNAPCKGRIQMRNTNPLYLFTFGLHRPLTGVSAKGPLTDIARRHFPALVRRFGTEHVIRCQRTPNTLERKLTHRLDRDRVFDRREDARTD